MEDWTLRVIEYPNPTHHHKHREMAPFLLVEDTFRNVFYRFEPDEGMAIVAFVTDKDNGPASYSVHLIGGIIDLTQVFHSVKSPESKIQVTESPCLYSHAHTNEWCGNPSCREK